MADLVCDDFGELVRLPGPVDEALKDIDVAAGKSDRIGLWPANDLDFERYRQPGGGLDHRDEIIEFIAGLDLLRRVSAFERETAVPAVEARAHLPFDDCAELAFD